MPRRSTMRFVTRPMRITCRMLVSGRAYHPPNDSLGGLPHRLGPGASRGRARPYRVAAHDGRHTPARLRRLLPRAGRRWRCVRRAARGRWSGEAARRGGFAGCEGTEQTRLLLVTICDAASGPNQHFCLAATCVEHSSIHGRLLSWPFTGALRMMSRLTGFNDGARIRRD